MSMRVLVTGATGFVGLNIVDALHEAGHEAHAYVRATSNVKYLSARPVRLHTGELGDRARLSEAMRGLDGVIHCAGNTSCYDFDYPVLRATNVEGTRAVVDAAIAAGVRRLVYTSTTSTIGAEDDATRAWDEDTPLTGFRADSPYGRTKTEAEGIVRGALERGLATVILNPGEVIGAWDHTMQWGRMVLAVATDRVPFVPPGTGSFCCAREVGRAHVAALTRGALGARYNLGGTDATFADLLATIAGVTGVSFTTPPGTYAEHFARACEVLARHAETGELPMVEPYRMRVFGGHYRFDSSRAVRDLGYRVVPLVDMIRDAYAWYRGHGFLASRDDDARTTA
jgi:dihydroflavonol-4-reductase